MIPQKRAVTINDISGVGRCSVTVACPILSAAGIETSVLPTALLSTHTGGFVGYSFLDLTDEMSKIISHWNTLNMSFDAVLSGYLGSLKQINIVTDFIRDQKNKDCLVVVDPVMGDDGELYSTCTEQMRDEMTVLCRLADVITPNLTEACILTRKSIAKRRRSI